MKIFLTFLILFFSCINSAFSGKPSHEQWDLLLRKYVNNQGKVNYKGFIKDSVELNKYLKLLSAHPPDEKSWSKNEQLAYWLNAYNAFTVQLIIRYYPVKSINDIKGKVKNVNSPWDIRFIKIGNETYDLNQVEHQIIRARFNEPRIHFALVCAAVSCPKLRNEAYTPIKLDEQLKEQAVTFINDGVNNKITANAIEVSQIFNWFKEDFTKSGTLIDFLNQFSKTKINVNVSIKYLEYNWNLNEQ